MEIITGKAVGRLCILRAAGVNFVRSEVNVCAELNYVSSTTHEGMFKRGREDLRRARVTKIWSEGRVQKQGSRS